MTNIAVPDQNSTIRDMTIFQSFSLSHIRGIYTLFNLSPLCTVIYVIDIPSTVRTVKQTVYGKGWSLHVQQYSNHLDPTALGISTNVVHNCLLTITNLKEVLTIEQTMQHGN